MLLGFLHFLLSIESIQENSINTITQIGRQMMDTLQKIVSNPCKLIHPKISLTNSLDEI